TVQPNEIAMRTASGNHKRDNERRAGHNPLCGLATCCLMFLAATATSMPRDAEVTIKAPSRICGRAYSPSSTMTRTFMENIRLALRILAGRPLVGSRIGENFIIGEASDKQADVPRLSTSDWPRYHSEMGTDYSLRSETLIVDVPEDTKDGKTRMIE